MSKCPLCDIRVSCQHNLKTHLAGREPNGHGKSDFEAEDISRRVFDGACRIAPETIPIAPAGHSAELLSNPYAAFLIRLFESLVSNKQLPKYQFERRVDAMIMVFLPGILRELRGWNVELVAPEFPLRKNTSKRSTNVDHLLFRHADASNNKPAWIFFELKTDSASCNDCQIEIYRAAMDAGMPRLLADLGLIAAATNARAKYAMLSSRVARFPEGVPMELVYLAPCRIDVADPRAVALTFRDLEALSLPDFSEVWELFRKTILPALRV